MSLMILGCASHVGKSVSTAAICRALHRRGYSVAPFKSQNMSLNSYVTEDGAEIGIAQAMQAYAACTEPTADMNPILLKPKGDQSSQIVLLGRPYRDVHIRDYYDETNILLEEALSAYRRLRERFDHVIVEGAGGAAEINLYDRDIANIRLARRLKIPIVIVADIERGGVFAQLYGTYMLLPEDIRPLVSGFIINKFRGDKSLFDDGVRLIEEITGVRVLGVVPYTEIPLPSEDSLSLQDKRRSAGEIRVAVIRLDRISNFTDFEQLERLASVDYVRPGTPLSGYDCIIIPGTKNSVVDLTIINESGTSDEIVRARENEVPIIGICGGYQMLGREIIDSGIEGCEGPIKGIGLLDVVTRFSAYEKTTMQVERTANEVGPILSAMGTVKGYEIHMGETIRGDCMEAFDGEGAASTDGLVFGTYMHGLFNNTRAVDALLSYLCLKKGIAYKKKTELHDQCTGDDIRSSPGYEMIADHYELHTDMDYIEKIVLSGREKLG